MADEGQGNKQEAFEAAVDSFLTTIGAATKKIGEGIAPAPPVREPLSKEKLAKIAGAETAEAISTFAEEGVLPVMLDSNRKMAKIRRESAMKDPEVAPLLKKYKKEIDAEIQARGGDVYVAEHGLDALTFEIANRDPKFREAKVEEEVQRRLTEERAKPPVAPVVVVPAVVPQEGVQAGAVGGTSPAAAKTVAEQIAATEVSQEDATFYRKNFGMSIADIQKQRFEIAAMERKHGATGLKREGGIPICSLEDIGVPELPEELEDMVR
jgi:hypothetical protein